jgi:1-acyl-sn-glycerol-3-phosphate acyltransferase
VSTDRARRTKTRPVDEQASSTATERAPVESVDLRDSTSLLPARIPQDRPARRATERELAALRTTDVDEWGRSESTRRLVRNLYDPIYKHWFRAEWEGFENIPGTGGALLVANHAGAVPSDAPVIMHGIERDLGRPVYGLAENLFRTIPLVGTAWSRAGGVNAHPDNAYRLLREQGQLVLVFPEGVKGTSKHHRRKYRLARFGRGGFVEIAMRSGVPIVPIAVMGNEETAPIVAKLPALAKAFGIPYFPITPQMMVLGPFGATVPFPAKFRLRVLKPVTFDVEPNKDRYSQSLVMGQAERIRDMIQTEVLEMVAERNSWWRG